jgi:threonine dehydratase
VVGVLIPKTEMDGWTSFLSALGYAFWEESKNPAYSLFL